MKTQLPSKNHKMPTFLGADDSASLVSSSASADRFFGALGTLGLASAGGGAGWDARRPERRGSTPAVSETLRGGMMRVWRKRIYVANLTLADC